MCVRMCVDTYVCKMYECMSASSLHTPSLDHIRMYTYSAYTRTYIHMYVYQQYPYVRTWICTSQVLHVLYAAVPLLRDHPHERPALLVTNVHVPHTKFPSSETTFHLSLRVVFQRGTKYCTYIHIYYV